MHLVADTNQTLSTNTMNKLIFTHDEGYQAGLQAYATDDYLIKKKLLTSKAKSGFKQAISDSKAQDYKRGYELGYSINVDDPSPPVEGSVAFKTGYDDGFYDNSQELPNYYVEQVRTFHFEEGRTEGYNNYWSGSSANIVPETNKNYLEGLETGYLEAEDEDYWSGYQRGQEEALKYRCRSCFSEESATYVEGYHAGFSASMFESIKLSLFQEDELVESDDSPLTVVKKSPTSPREKSAAFTTYTDDEIRSNSLLDPDRYNRMEKTEKGWQYFDKAGSPTSKAQWDKEFLNKKYFL